MDVISNLDSQRNEEKARSAAMAKGGSSKAASFSLAEGSNAEQQEHGGCFIASGGNGSSATKIKLKIPKLPEELTNSGVKEFSHICKECGKGYSSGKALGGHMSSAHVQAKDKLKSKRSLLEGDSDDEKYLCGICHKQFPSSKSLYGHMRLHPERQWRGMEPLNHPNRVVPFWSARVDGGGKEIDGLDFFEEGESLDWDLRDDMGRVEYALTDFGGGGWSQTGRRGQKLGVQLFDFADFANEEEKSMLIQAARDLVLLACKPPLIFPRYDEFSFKKEKCNELVIYSSPSSDDDSEQTLVGNVSFGNGKSLMDSASTFSMDLDEGGIGRKRKRMTGKIPNDVQLTPLSETHKCNTCNKYFSTHQALGGHRSSHNKVKFHVENAVDQVNNLEGFRSTKLPELSGIERVDTKVGSDKNSGDEIATLHECEVCGKRFPTGQTLGGHKRCHYTGGSSTAPSSSPTYGIGGVKLERMVHQFDLNVPLADEDHVDM